jgi:hypothetical protein
MELDSRRVGEWVQIEFMDHAIISGKGVPRRTIPCRVSGMVVSVSKTHVVLAHWVIYDSCQATRDANREEVVILKRAIKRWGIADVIKWYST